MFLWKYRETRIIYVYINIHMYFTRVCNGKFIKRILRTIYINVSDTERIKSEFRKTCCGKSPNETRKYFFFFLLLKPVSSTRVGKFYVFFLKKKKLINKCCKYLKQSIILCLSKSNRYTRSNLEWWMQKLVSTFARIPTMKSE